MLEIISSDGAVFERSDPLAVVLGTTVGSNVLEWILPSVAQRYMESCRQLQTGKYPQRNCSHRVLVLKPSFHYRYTVPDDHIKSTLEMIQATHQLTLTDQPPLRTDLFRCLCRAIHHQANVDTIDLSRNCLEDDGFRHLVDALDTIRPKTLRLSGNQITSAGLAYLAKKLINPVAGSTANVSGRWLDDLHLLDLSFNPLGEATSELRTLLENSPALRSLSLTSTGLRQLEGGARLIGLTALDVGHNELTAGAVRTILLQLNACKIAELRLGFCGGRTQTPASGAQFAKYLAEFLQTGTLDAMRVLDVSGWQLDDSDVYEVVHTLRRAPRLEELWAQQNTQLGAMGFAQLVGSLRVKRLYLDGCGGVVRHLGAQSRSAMDTTDGSATRVTECVWVRLPKFANEQDVGALRQFWSHVHGARASVTCMKLRTVLETQEP